MGTWSVDVLGNDIALDFIILLETEFEFLLRTNEGFKIYDLLREKNFPFTENFREAMTKYIVKTDLDNEKCEVFLRDLIIKGMSLAELNEEYLALTEFFDIGIKPKWCSKFDELVEVIEEELSSELINRWRVHCRGERIKILSEVLDNILSIKNKSYQQGGV